MDFQKQAPETPKSTWSEQELKSYVEIIKNMHVKNQVALSAITIKDIVTQELNLLNMTATYSAGELDKLRGSMAVELYEGLRKHGDFNEEFLCLAASHLDIEYQDPMDPSDLVPMP